MSISTTTLVLALAGTALALNLQNVPPIQLVDDQRYDEYEKLVSASPRVCEEEACAFIREEVDGLSRLKVIRTYVSETVRLLDSLMGSMDEELVKIATRLKETGADSCPNLPSPLDYIAQPMDRSPDMVQVSETIDVTDGSSTSSSYNKGRSINSYDEERGNDRNSDLFSGIEQHMGSDEEEDSQSSNSWSGSQRTSSTSSTSTSWSQNEDNNRDSREDVVIIGKGTPYAGSQSTSGPPRGSQTGSNSWSQRDYTQHQNNNGAFTSSSTWQPVSKKNCVAVRGPYFNSGMDDWCFNNCNGGYCPPAFCVCQ